MLTITTLDGIVITATPRSVHHADSIVVNSTRPRTRDRRRTVMRHVRRWAALQQLEAEITSDLQTAQYAENERDEARLTKELAEVSMAAARELERLTLGEIAYGGEVLGTPKCSREGASQ